MVEHPRRLLKTYVLQITVSVLRARFSFQYCFSLELL